MFDEALQYLLSLGHETLAIKLGLGTTKRLLEALGDPYLSYPSIQIAGTNGKGSTAAMLEGITRAAGIRTGLYTSPHLISITERIRIAGLDITREAFAPLATKVRTCAEHLVSEGALPAPPTFFEQMTAIALLALKEAGVELAILETGLGGRLDATTTAGAKVVGITQIALDHQQHLGSTLTEIAAEKAAIIRPGVTAIIAPQLPEVLDVIVKRCADCGVIPLMVEGAFEAVSFDETGRARASFVSPHDRYDEVQIGLRGRHQVGNAAVAIALAEALREGGFSIPRESIAGGLQNAEHRGRLELHPRRPPILLDGAHNIAGAEALRAFIEEFVKPPITLVFGAMGDKDLDGIAKILFPIAEQLILTRPNNPRAADVELLLGLAPQGFESSRITLTLNSDEALNAARARTPPNGTICVTGSLYLVGEILGLLNEQVACRKRADI
ncbi:MAG: dihydrofolate synthase / folylpolyglutamate synthase [Acidobacteriota bacterium]|jgi:dihydrofolate synthase/folylpolyglutamate synthase|nr:dihydrofolate synthase / folylpolyglutamate synthase [Acidobacteriota bacterium]